MKRSGHKSMLTRISGVCLCLLLCSSVAASESGNQPQPEEKTATDTQGDQAGTEQQHEDIVDRAFSPLDKAVSDINRDINEEDEKQAAEPPK